MKGTGMKQQVKVIKTQRDYDAAVLRLSALMDEEIAPGSSKEAELELLALVIESYERSKVEPVVSEPIEAILFRMDQLGLRKVDLVPYMGSLPKVSEVLARKRPLNLAMIRKLHQELGIPADVLLSKTDDSVDLSEVPSYDPAKFPIKEMISRGYFEGFRGTLQEARDNAEELIRSFMRGIHLHPTQQARLRAPMFGLYTLFSLGLLGFLLGGVGVVRDLLPAALQAFLRHPEQPGGGAGHHGQQRERHSQRQAGGQEWVAWPGAWELGACSALGPDVLLCWAEQAGGAAGGELSSTWPPRARSRRHRAQQRRQHHRGRHRRHPRQQQRHRRRWPQGCAAVPSTAWAPPRLCARADPQARPRPAPAPPLGTSLLSPAAPRLAPSQAARARSAPASTWAAASWPLWTCPPSPTTR
jgi:antitoxin component HigA of HigAB toxin-antitoxin module